MKRRLVAFWEILVLVERVMSYGVASKEQKKKIIKTRLLVEATIKEERRVIFGE